MVIYPKLFRKKLSFKFEVAICCIVKDEQYLPEWIEYHAEIAVTHFYIYDNGSATPVNETLKTYIDEGLVTVIPFPGTVMQLPAYDHCLKHYGHLCKWIAFIDADEFIIPKNLTGNLAEFLVDYEPYGGLGINWLVFGSNGHINKPNDTQLKSYVRRSLKSHQKNEHVKSIIQPRYVKHSLDPHHFRYKKKKYSVNENFTIFSGPFSAHSTNKIQINHYFLRSKSDFIQKRERGRADTTVAEYQRSMDDFYETDKNANLIADESILEVQMLARQIKSGVKQESLLSLRNKS